MNRFKRLALAAILSLTLGTPAFAEIGASPTGSPLFSEDFSGWQGNGFAPAPAAGQLDSNLWRVRGLSDGDGSFGGTHASGDFARGSSVGNVSTGGIYAFAADGNTLLGVQPGGSDFTPGSFDLRLVNDTAATIEALQLAYRILVRNDQPRANSLNFEWSIDDSTYTTVPELDFLTPETADAAPAWVATPRQATLTGFAVAPGASIVLRWSSDDVSGGGSRDEFGVDDIQVLVVAPPALNLNLTGPTVALAGSDLTATLSLVNPADSDPLQSVVLTATLPTGISYIADSSGVTPVLAGNTVEWSFGALAPQATIDFELSLASDPGISAGATLTSEFELTADSLGSPVSSSDSFMTVFPPLLTIRQIQEVVDPASNDASPFVGQTVATEGVVSAAPGQIEGPGTLVIQSEGGGPWSGLVIDGDFTAQTLARGERLQVIGQVVESFGLTRLSAVAVEALGPGIVPLPQLLNTGSLPQQTASLAERWEAVLLEFADVSVTADSGTLGNGEWQFDDGSGPARGDDAGSISFTPTTGDQYGFLRGIGWFSFGNYKLQPRDNGDIDFTAESFEIFEIQGDGPRSPFAPAAGQDPGQVVTTRDNIVTAVAANGFFIQMPDDRPSTALPLASRGLFVFTGGAPAVQVGDRVNVTGAVAEFFDFTQITQPDNVSVLSSNATLPQAVILDADTPSPDPQTLSCGETNFECFEGMRVAVADGFVTAPSQSFGSDPVAEAWISADGARILRGSGEIFPGVPGCAGCPVWGGAPERFEIDPDRFGLLSDPLAAGTRFWAEGVIGFSFGDYALWPTTLKLSSLPTLPRPVAQSSPGQLTIASLNALNLFDDVLGAPRPITVCGGGRQAIDREVPSPAEYAIKLNKLAVYIVEAMRLPDVIALQEVESVETLDDLAAEIMQLSGVQYSAWLEPSSDIGNINNGYLVNPARIAVEGVTQQAGDECLSVDGSPLHDRAPLLLRARFLGAAEDWPFAVFNNHLRSLGGVATSSRNRLKRHEQAQSTARLIQDLQNAEPNLPILAVGDFNSFQFSDGFVDPLNQIRGLADPSQNLVSLENAANPSFDDSNLTDPPLQLGLERLPQSEHYSFIFRGVSQTLDHALLDDTAWRSMLSFEFVRGNVDAWFGFESDPATAARSSDHDGFVLRLDPDRLFADGFESGSL